MASLAAVYSGSGPLVGPVLASQWGYFPGFCWIVIGSCLAGAVHDFVVLLASVRFDGLSLPNIARKLLGPFAGLVDESLDFLVPNRPEAQGFEQYVAQVDQPCAQPEPVRLDVLVDVAPRLEGDVTP